MGDDKPSPRNFEDLPVEDDALKRWKTKLNITEDITGDSQLTVVSLFHRAPGKEIEILVDGKDNITRRKEPFIIKKDTDVSIGIRFKLSGNSATLQYDQLIKWQGSESQSEGVFDQRIGWFGVAAEIQEATLCTLNYPSAGWFNHKSYRVSTMIKDGKGHELAEWEWYFKMTDD